MKTYLVPLFIVLMATGCGKSYKDVAGTYNSDEIVESNGTGRSYDSTTWSLDLSESGSFTLRKTEFQKFVESKKYAPRPKEVTTSSGKWELEKGFVSLVIEKFLNGDKYPTFVTIELSVQSNSDLVLESIRGRGGDSAIEDTDYSESYPKLIGLRLSMQ